MSAIPYAVAALVIAGTTCAAGFATLQAHPAPDAFVCELHLSEHRGTVTLTAEAQAPHATRGVYSLTVDHRSAGGRSTMRQGGAFDLKAGERGVLSQASFAARARDLSAELTLNANGQSTTCSALTL